MDTDISQKMGNYGNQSKDGDTKKDVNCNPLTPPHPPQKKRLEGGEGGRRRSFSCKKTSAVSEEKGRVVGMGGRAGAVGLWGKKRHTSKTAAYITHSDRWTV